MEGEVLNVIRYSEENHLWSNAIFYAERYYAEKQYNIANSTVRGTAQNVTQEQQALHVLASVYYKAGKVNKAYLLLLTAHKTALSANHDNILPSSPDNRYLFALCCYELDKYKEAESALTGQESRGTLELLHDRVPNGAPGFYLLGLICKKSNRRHHAIECFKKSLSLNPFMWCAYEELCKLGEVVDPSTVFDSSWHHMDTDATQSDEMSVSSGMHVDPSSPFPSNQLPSTVSQTLPRFSLSTPGTATSVGFAHVPITPSNAASPMDFPHVDPLPYTPSPVGYSTPANAPKQARKKGEDKRKVLFQTPESSERKGSTRMSLPDKSVDTKKVVQKTATRGRRTSYGNLSKNKTSQSVLHDTSTSEANKENKSSMPTPITPLIMNVTNDEHPQIDHSGVIALLSLLKQFGSAYSLLCSYRCQEAIAAFHKLPPAQFNTGWVLCQLGRAHYEIVDYQGSKQLFEQARQLEPWRTEGMEIYSTVLWHLRKEVELSYLAHELIEFDKLVPECWCVVGNCFSLLKEHESAVKFFQRALQLDPSFTYAYTLCGHEHVACDDLDKAVLCFRNALRMDDRHYNAWYGLGMIYFRQEKYEQAEYNFRRAISINGGSSVLYCYLGMVLHANKKSTEGLNMLDKAIQLDPKNSLALFKRATVLASLDQHENALSELHTLRAIAPKEATIYYLLGKIYKRLKQPDKAMFYFTTALDLDSKSSNINYIKSAIDKLHMPDAEEEDFDLT